MTLEDRRAHDPKWQTEILLPLLKQGFVLEDDNPAIGKVAMLWLESELKQHGLRLSRVSSGWIAESFGDYLLRQGHALAKSQAPQTVWLP